MERCTGRCQGLLLCKLRIMACCSTVDLRLQLSTAIASGAADLLLLQVIETPVDDKGPNAQQPRAMFEADRGTSLSHPHVVQTFKSHTALSKVAVAGICLRVDRMPFIRRAVGPTAARPRLSPFHAASPSQMDGKPYQETWLLLEFCDHGSLQDAMDRGAFRPVRLGEEGSQVRRAWRVCIDRGLPQKSTARS